MQVSPKLISTQTGTISSKNTAAPTQSAASTTSGEKFTPSNGVIGLADPSKYPDYHKNFRRSDAPTKPLSLDHLGLDPKAALGTDDSPCFYDGRVMTIREAKALAG